MIFVIGDRGTAKTSTILQSGIEPELLAGQVYQDNAVTPTRTANIFYARGTRLRRSRRRSAGNPASLVAPRCQAPTRKIEIPRRRTSPPRRPAVLRSRNLHPPGRRRVHRQRRPLPASPPRRNLPNPGRQLPRIRPVYPRGPPPLLRRIRPQPQQRRSRPGSRRNSAHAPRQRLRCLRRRRKPAPHRSLHPALSHLLRSTPAPAPARNRRRKTSAVLRIPPRISQTPQRPRAVSGRHRTSQPASRQPLPARLLFLRSAPRHHDRSSRRSPSHSRRTSRSQRSHRHVPRRSRSPAPRPTSASRTRRWIAESSPVAVPRTPVQRRNPSRRIRPQSQRLQHQNQHAKTRPLRHRRRPVPALLDPVDRFFLRKPLPGTTRPRRLPRPNRNRRRQRVTVRRFVAQTRHPAPVPSRTHRLRIQRRAAAPALGPLQRQFRSPQRPPRLLFQVQPIALRFHRSRHPRVPPAHPGRSRPHRRLRLRLRFPKELPADHVRVETLLRSKPASIS